MLFLTSIFQSQSQSLGYRQFSPEEGLPSSQIFDVVQDRSGFIWVATDHGIAKYDGYSFQIFTTRDGLGDNTVFELAITDDDKIWASTYTAGVFEIAEDHLVPFRRNDMLLKHLSGAWVTEWYHRDGQQFFKQSTGTNIYKIAQDSIMVTNGSIELVNNPFSDFQNFELELRLKQILALEGEETMNLVAQEQAMLNYISERSLKNYIDNLYFDRNGGLWISCNTGRGAVYYPNFYGNPDSKPKQFFENISVTAVFQDDQSNYWFSTLHDGLLMVPSLAITNYGFKEGIPDLKITAATKDEDAIYFASYNGYKYVFKNNKVSTLQGTGTKEIIYDILKLNGGKLLSTNDFFAADNKFHPNITRSIVATNEGGYLLGSSIHLKKVTASGQEVWKISDSDFKRIYSLFEDSKDQVWIGTINGLFLKRGTDIKNMSLVDSLFKHRITSIGELEDGTLVFGTRGAGLLLYKDSVMIQLRERDGLNSNLINSIHVHANEIWVGSHKGLNRVSFSDAASFNIGSWNLKDGLPSNEINDILYAMDELWLATNAGISSIDIEKLNVHSARPPTRLLSFQAGDQFKSLEESIDCSWSENDISIAFTGLEFRDPLTLQYKYRLLGQDSNWNYTANRDLRFTNLPGGNYEFQIQTVSGKGTLGQVQAIKFDVAKHFSKTWWFLALLIILGIALISGIAYLIFKQRAKKIQRQRALLVSEQKALRSQMNPHFIFNALNSIHYFITENDKRNASIFLSKFSNLIRQVLENSKKNLVTLEEEIESLETYLELEQLRFNEKIEYKINTSPEIRLSEIYMPTMILQPYIENAIWHGLTPKSSKGLLRIDFQIVNDELKVVIEDDGIGRAAAALSSKKKGHKSTGMQNIKERVDLFNAQYNTKMSTNVIDLEDENGKALGTRVEIIFPFRDFE